MSLRPTTILAAACVAALTVPGLAQDDPVPGEEPTRLHGIDRLAPPEDASHQDASGWVFLTQRDERSAIHVHVGGLEPGAGYEVQISGEAASEAIGTITTHDGAVPPPRTFRGRLSLPEDPEAEDPDGEGQGEGDGGEAEEGDDGEAEEEDGDRRRRWGWGWRRHGHRFWRRRSDDEARSASGSALLRLNEERTEAAYRVSTRGLEAEVSAISLLIGDESIELDPGGSGTVALTAEQVEGLDAGLGSVSVTAGEQALTGGLEASNGRAERAARRRAGRGSLRLDTDRGDVLPLGAASIADLVGAGLSVVDAEGTTVLVGAVGELHERRSWRHRRRGNDDDEAEEGAEGEDGEEGVEDPVEEAIFEVEDAHDSSFVRGDANDSGGVDMADAIVTLRFLFQGGAAPYCADAADADDNGRLEISDALLTLGVLYLGAPDLPAPFPDRGFDPTTDELFCYGSSE